MTIKLLKTLRPPLSSFALKEALGLEAAPELALIHLDDLLAMIKGGKLDPGKYLHPDELEKFHLFRYEKRRIEWLGGRLAAKKTVLDLLDIPDTGNALRSWPVFVEENGRPFFRSTTGQDFALSISHSHGLASSMVVNGPRCGLDIQKISAAAVRVKEKFCTGQEDDLLANLTPLETDKPAAVLTLLWSAKEALRKAMGGHPLTGFLEMTLEEITTTTEKSWTFCLRAKDIKHQIVVFIYQDYAVALCTA